MPKWLAPAALGGIVLLAVLSLVGTARSHQKFAAETSAVAVPADTQGNHVCSVLGSGLTCALQLGNNFVRGDFSPILHRLHPGHLLWRGEEAGELENFAREKVSLSSLMMKHGSVYFHGVNAMAEGKAPAKPALTKFEPLSTRDSGNSLWKASH